MVESTKGGNVVLKGLNVPDSEQPGSLITVEAVAENHALAINPFDPDRCSEWTVGYTIEAEFQLPDGSTVTKGPVCVLNTDSPDSEKRFTADVEVPESVGRHEVQARLTLPGSGKQTGWMSQSFQVSEDEPTEPDRDDSSGGWFEPIDGGGSGESGGSGGFGLGLSEQATLALVVLALLAIAWMADNTVGVLD